MKNLKFIFLLLILIPFPISSIEWNDSILHQKEIADLRKNIEQINYELSLVTSQLKVQENLNEKTFNSLSTQLSGATYSITIFGLLFAIAAIILGIYVTRIENKVVQLRDENKLLLAETIKNKEEVVSINNLIQKDIYGLFLKIKREETNHLLNRLVLIPQDIANVGSQLFSRDLEKEDFEVLKNAYLKLMELPESQRGSTGIGTSYEDSFRLLFFQHFLDLSMKDDIICKDIVDFFEIGINCSFKNDITKSTNDFITALLEIGIKTKENEISIFMKGISNSQYKDSGFVYNIVFNKLPNRNNQFDFFNLIIDSKDCRIGKSSYGKILKEKYSSTELSETELEIIDKTNSIIEELDKEEQDRKVLGEKRKAAAAEKKKLQEEKVARQKSR